MHPIRLTRAIVVPEAVEAAARVLASGWIGQGPETTRFEAEFASYVGAPVCVALSSGTVALQFAMRCLDLPAGAEVITTPITFVPTNHAILLAGAHPVFADVQPDTGNLDPVSVERHLSERTAAIMVVHYGGYPADLDELYGLAKRHGLRVIEDCAHASGATYRGARIGGIGDLRAFSFGPVKNLTAVQGGALVVRRPEDAVLTRRLRFHGIDRERYHQVRHPPHAPDYDVLEVGTNGTMNDVAAAIARVHLASLDEANARRGAIVAHYRARLEGVEGLHFHPLAADRTSAHYLCPMLVDGRDSLLQKLAAASVEAGVFFRRNDRFPMYEASNLPNAEAFQRRVLCLPLHADLRPDEVEYVCDVIAGGW